jgi:purine-binding chemotaxis protein CheW
MTSVLSRQYCTFWVGGLYLGISVGDVQEVLRHQGLIEVPRSSDSVRGLINLRGQIVVAIDLRTRLGVTEHDDSTLPAMNVVVRSRGELVGFLVDEVDDVIDTADAVLELAPTTLPSTLRDVTLGVVALPDSLLFVLDPDRAADIPPVRSPGGMP